MDKVLRTLGVLDIEVLPRHERPTQTDIAKAQQIAWTMSLEAQPLTDDGFRRILDKIVAHPRAQTAA
jgi:hypothetical protein